MLDTILCFACGNMVKVEVTRLASSSFEANKKARENDCPKCGVTLELIANMEAGKERMERTTAEYRHRQAVNAGFEFTGS